MKYNKFLKKMAAGLTTVTMLASLGVTAFAADVLVEDYNKVDALDITSVDAYYTLNGETKNYTVTVNYSGAGEGDQVTVLGYLYDETDTTLTAVPADSAIYAVNQEEGKGSTVIKLSSAGEKVVAGTETLIIKMGSDAEGITNAQAVRINLASAELKQADLVVEAITPVPDAAVAYGSGKNELMGQLPDYVTVTGTRDGVADTTGASVNVVWNVADDWTANNIAGMTVTGTLQATDSVVLGSYTTVTANVTVNPLTTAEVVAPAAVEVVVGADAAAIAAKVKTVTVKSGDITDTYTVSAANVTGFDTAAEGSTTATITISGKSANGIFDLAEMTTTVDITVKEAPSAVKGDVDGDGFVMPLDSINLANYFLGTYTLGQEAGNSLEKAQFAADVDGDGFVMPLDSINLANYFLGTYTIEN